LSAKYKPSFSLFFIRKKLLSNLLADIVVLLHFCFVLFVMLGGFLVLWKPFLARFHVPAVMWGAAIEFMGWVCPLTFLENMLRGDGNKAQYGTGFVEHYIVPVLYPDMLTRYIQIGLGVAVLTINIVLYLVIWRRQLQTSEDGDQA
jgi:hypothetical protein